MYNLAIGLCCLQVAVAFVTITSDQWVTLGTNATVTCSVSTVGSFTRLQFRRSHTSVTDVNNAFAILQYTFASKDIIYNPVTDINHYDVQEASSGGSYSLIIKSVTLDDSWKYWCRFFGSLTTPAESASSVTQIRVPVSMSTFHYDGNTHSNGDSIPVVAGDGYQFTYRTPAINPAATFTWTLTSGSTIDQPSGTQTDSANSDDSRLVDSSNTINITIPEVPSTSMLTCGATNRQDGLADTEIDVTVALDVRVRPKVVKLSDSSGDKLPGATVGVNQSTSHTFTCLLQGTRPAATIAWLVAGSTPATGVGDPTSTPINGLLDTSGTWSFIPERDHHRKEVKCIANTAESQQPFPSSMITLDVNGPPDSPVVTGSLTMTEGQPTSLTCTADMGYPDNWSLVWSIGGTSIPGPITAPSPSPSPSRDRFMFTSTFDYTPMREDNDATINCGAEWDSWTPNIKDSFGPINVRYEPNITNKADNEVGAQDGANADLQCIAVGNPIPTFMWYNPNNTVITSDGSKYTVKNKITGGDNVFEYIVTGTLTIHRVDSQVDYGQYTCVTSNGIGAKDSLKINLTGPSRPASPTGVRIIGLAADSLTVRWTAWYDGGQDQWFRVSYMKTGGSDDGETFSDIIPGRVNMYTVTGLEAYTDYDIRVYAENAAGQNPEYGNIFAHTLPELPNDLDIEYNKDGDTVKIAGLQDTNGCIQLEVQYVGSRTWYQCGECIRDNIVVTLSEWCTQQQQRRRRAVTDTIEDVRARLCYEDICSERVYIDRAIKPSSSTGIIVGVIIGVAVLIVVSFTFGFLAGRKLKNQKEEGERPLLLSKSKSDLYAQHDQLPSEVGETGFHNIDTTEMDVLQRGSQRQDDATYANVRTEHKAFQRDQLNIVKELGRGAFGQVHLAEATGITARSEVTLVAVKTLKEGENSNKKQDMIQELDLMRKLPDHPNLVKLLGFCIEQDPVYIIVEYLSRGNLKDLLKDSRSKGGRVYGNLHGISKSLTSKDLMKFAKDAAEGMAFLSSQQCIHRDLAARNVLVAEDMVCKVSDFGLARDVMNIRVYERSSEVKLPLRWMALESVVDDVYTTESDVWSFGVLFWEIVTLGARPYPAISAKMMIDKLQSGYRMPKPQHCQRELYELMLMCWNEDPGSRPTFQMISGELQKLMNGTKVYISIKDYEETIYEVTPEKAEHEKV